MAKQKTTNEYDPYREALVIEETTIWPPEYDEWDAATKLKYATQLHADPENAVELEYIRLHTGFERVIRVTAADIERL